jgi:hypothetical protein
MKTTGNIIPFPAIILLFVAMCIVIPVTAASGIVTITLRGSGSYYLGDSVYVDGINTAGNTTLIRITGPGLPAEGVPPFNLAGAPGSGNTANVNADGKWTFRWDIPKDSPKLQTAKYTIIASDTANPEKTSSTVVFLTKPEFYMTVKPSSARAGDYVEVTGIAESGIDYIKFNVTDASGSVFHTYMTPVSGTGSFQYGFHVDMSPGQYNIVGTNPSMKNNLQSVLTVTEPQTTAIPSGASSPGQVTLENSPAPTQTGEAVTVTTAMEITPSKTGVASTTIILALCIFGAVMVLRSGTRKN